MTANIYTVNAAGGLVTANIYTVHAAGGLVTANLAHAMEPFVTSVAIGKDCIPRMSLKNLSRFMEGEHAGSPVLASSASQVCGQLSG